MHSKKMEKKTIIVVGGVGEKWGDKQFRQQYRVIDRKKINYALNAASFNGLVIKKWRESESSKQQKRDGSSAESQE